MGNISLRQEETCICIAVLECLNSLFETNGVLSTLIDLNMETMGNWSTCENKYLLYSSNERRSLKDNED